MKNDIAIERLVLGPLEVNCYIVSDPASQDAFIIDPGAEPDKIERFLKKHGLKAKFIINTHGHGDHIAADDAFDLPVYIHPLDSGFLTDPEKNLSGAFGFPLCIYRKPLLLEPGGRVMFGALGLDILHTPGHTPGSISIRCGNAVFTGDALFRDSIGRTDFTYGNERLLIRSIKDKLMQLDDDTLVYPGHGEPSTIGRERRHNPFLI